MATSFFDIDDGHGFERDDFGIDLTDISSAKKEQLAILPCIAKERRGLDCGDLVCEVRDETGRRVMITRLTLTAL